MPRLYNYGPFKAPRPRTETDPMERRPFGRDWGLVFRMTVCLALLVALYLPFFAGMITTAYLLWGAPGGFLVAVGSLALLALAPYLSELLALSAARAQVRDGAIERRLRPVMERLCGLADLPLPRLGVMPTDVPNAFSAGRSAKHAVVIVTQGLLDRLDDEELEAVLAHELAHIANRDAFVMTIAAAPTMVGRKLIWGFASLPVTADGIGKKVLAAVAVLYFLPLLFVGWIVYAFATLLVMSIARYREYVADRGAAILTGTPEQLMSALQKIADAFPHIPERDLRDAMRMNAFFVLPTRTEKDSFEVDPMRIFPTHPPLERRLERLAELARDLGRPRGLPAAPAAVALAAPAGPRPDNPHALAAFFLAVIVWGMGGGLLVVGTDVMEGMLWVSVLGSLALAGGVFLGFQGVGRASAGAQGMGYAVAGLVLLLGPWALAMFAVVVFGALALVGLGPIG
jgi:heat shock protein HtpX